MSNPAPPTSLPTIHVRADSGRSSIDFSELIRYRDLLWSLSDRDVRIRYKQTALGVTWVILQPLLAALIFTFVFGVVARMSGTTDGVPYILFTFVGLTAWNAFSTALTRVSTSLVLNSSLVSKIYFPRLILPLSTLGTVIIDFTVSLVVAIALMAYYRVVPGWGIILLPVWLLVLLGIALGMGVAAAGMMVHYRDIGIIIPVFLQLVMYTTPVVWPSTMVPERYRWILAINPLVGPLDAFRWSLFGQGHISLPSLAYSITTAALLCWLGTVVFKQQERTFADVL